MNNRSLLEQFVDGTHLNIEDVQTLVDAKLVVRDGDALMVTTAGSLLLTATRAKAARVPPPGDSASCPDDDTVWVTLRNPVDQERFNAEARARLDAAAKTQRHVGALDVQIGGDHYKNFPIQPVTFIEANRIPFLEGCIIKRVCRHGEKAKAQDLRKAIHELQLLIELRYGEKP